MLVRERPFLCLLPLFIFCLATASSRAAGTAVPASQTSHTLVLDGLGKGSAPIDGPWQFHLGDDPAWANPAFDDSHWEQLSADKSWGAQTHANYTGFAWYRKSIQISPAPGASPDVALMIPRVDDAYEIYWNGVKVGQLGTLPPHMVLYEDVPPQTYGLGPVRSGVLAVRVWKNVLASNDPDTLGGFEAAPVIGSPEAIAAAKATRDFNRLRRSQFNFGLTSVVRP